MERKRRAEKEQQREDEARGTGPKSPSERARSFAETCISDLRRTLINYRLACMSHSSSKMHEAQHLRHVSAEACERLGVSTAECTVVLGMVERVIAQHDPDAGGHARLSKLPGGGVHTDAEVLCYFREALETAVAQVLVCRNSPRMARKLLVACVGLCPELTLPYRVPSFCCSILGISGIRRLQPARLYAQCQCH